jgi:hypothetical protein
MKSPKTATTKDVIYELEREISVRKRVYPQWKLEGRITADVADHRLTCMERALELIKKIQPKQQNLFQS